MLRIIEKRPPKWPLQIQNLRSHPKEEQRTSKKRSCRVITWQPLSLQQAYVPLVSQQRV